MSSTPTVYTPLLSSLVVFVRGSKQDTFVESLNFAPCGHAWSFSRISYAQYLPYSLRGLIWAWRILENTSNTCEKLQNACTTHLSIADSYSCIQSNPEVCTAGTCVQSESVSASTLIHDPSGAMLSFIVVQLLITPMYNLLVVIEQIAHSRGGKMSGCINLQKYVAHASRDITGVIDRMFSNGRTYVVTFILAEMGLAWRNLILNQPNSLSICYVAFRGMNSRILVTLRRRKSYI